MQASELEKDYLNLYTSALPPAISQILDKAIFSSNSLQQVLDLILFMALQLTGAEYGSLRWMNHRTNKLIMKAVRHHSKQTLAIDDFPDLSLKVDSVLARIANTKKSLMIPDLSQENWPQVYHPLDPNVPMRSELAIPILSSDKQAVMGVLNVESTKAGVFTADHLSYLNTLAERAKIAVSRAQLFDAIRIIGSKVLEMDQNSLFTYIVEALAELVQVAVCSIWLLEERDGNLVLKNSVGRSPEDTEAFDIRLKTDSFIGQVVSTLQPVSTRDVHRETNFYKKEYKDWKSLLAVPIVDTEKKVLGVISLISVEERSFTQHDIDLVTAFCSYLAVAIGQAKLLQEKEYNLKVVSSLQTITSTLATSNHLDALLNSIVEQANSLLEATGSILYLRSESIESNKVAAAVGKATTALGMLTPLTGSLSGHVTLHNEPLLTDINDPRIDLRIAQQIGIKYVAAVPLQLEDRSIGALVVLDKHSGKLPFTEADLKLLKALADEAAVAIKKQRLYEQLERHTCQVQVVKDILADSLTAVDVAALLKKAALRISKTFNYRVDIGLTQAGRLVFKASVLYGFKPNGQVRDIPANQGITGAALQTGGSILISDVSQNGRYQAFSSETRSELAVPLRSPNGNCVGVLNLESTQLDDFSKQDVQVFEAIADGITLALENTLGRKRLVVLNRISAAALQAQDLDQVMDMIMKTVVDLFSAGACALYLTIPGLQRLFLSHHIELPPNVVERVQELDLGKSIAGRVLRSGKSIYVRDMTTDPRADGTVTEEDGLRSLVDVPIKIDKRILGVLAVLTKEVRTFDEYDMSILEAIGNSIGTIIENARLNQEYKQLYESVRDPILIIDLNGKIVNANPEASLVSGYKHEELLGKHVTDLMLDRKTKQKARQRLTQLADGIDVPIMEVEIGHKNGSAIFIESKPTIVRNNRGYVTYIIAIWRDITIRKQTDEMLYRQRAADKVLEQMGSIGARVIHRMVGFLSTWRMGIRELRGRIVSITSTDEELFDVLESSSHRAFHFVDQFQRIRETVNQQKEIVTFRPLVIKAVEQANVPKQIDVHLQNLDLPPIVASKAILTDIIEGIIQNAISAMPAGGRLTISGGVNYSQQEVTLSFQDTGIGISEELQGNLFIPFPGSKQNSTGVGIGLWLSQLYIQTLGGDLKCVSALNQGATFIIYMPLQGIVTQFDHTADTEINDPENLGYATVTAVNTATTIRKVLILEDNEDFRSVLHNMFSHRDYLTQWTDSYDAAVDAVRQCVFDAFIVDICLKEQDLNNKDGIRFVTDLISQGTRVPVLILSAYSQALEAAQHQFEHWPHVRVLSKSEITDWKTIEYVLNE